MELQSYVKKEVDVTNKTHTLAETIWILLVLAAVATAILWIPYRLRQGGAPLPSSFRSIAVLPIRHAEGGSSYADCLVEAIGQGLAGRLAQIDSLKVAPWSDTRLQPQAGRSIPEIAQSLEVEAIVTCGAGKEGDRILLRLALIEGASGRLQWEERLTVRAAETATLEGRAALAVASKLRGRLTAGQSDALGQSAGSPAIGFCR